MCLAHVPVTAPFHRGHLSSSFGIPDLGAIDFDCVYQPTKAVKARAGYDRATRTYATWSSERYKTFISGQMEFSLTGAQAHAAHTNSPKHLYIQFTNVHCTQYRICDLLVYRIVEFIRQTLRFTDRRFTRTRTRTRMHTRRRKKLSIFLQLDFIRIYSVGHFSLCASLAHILLTRPPPFAPLAPRRNFHFSRP